MKFPFSPNRAGYTATVADGVLAINIPGGPPRSRLDTDGSASSVSATWQLTGSEFDLFQGYVRNWRRAGGAPVQMDLLLDSSAPETYDVMFQPGTLKLASVQGSVFTFSMDLWVLPLDKYLDEPSDPYGSMATLIDLYGGDVATLSQVLDMFKQLVTEDLPHTEDLPDA